MTRIASIAALLFASGCATTAGVPDLDPARLHDARFPGIEPRVVALDVVDQRTGTPDPEAKTVANVKRAIIAVLDRSGLAVRADAPNRFVLTLRTPDDGLADVPKEACVLVVGALLLPDASTQAQGQACFEYRHLLGFSLGQDSTRAYEMALNVMLDALARPPNPQ